MRTRKMETPGAMKLRVECLVNPNMGERDLVLLLDEIEQFMSMAVGEQVIHTLKARVTRTMSEVWYSEPQTPPIAKLVPMPPMHENIEE